MLDWLRKLYGLRYYRRNFQVREYSIKPKNALPGQEVSIEGIVVNNSGKNGTVYVIVLLASAYDHQHPCLDTHRDFNNNSRRALRVVSIPPWGSRPFVLRWRIQKDVSPGVYDLRIELWTPAKLFPNFRWPYLPHCLYTTKWDGLLEIIAPAGFSQQGGVLHPVIPCRPRVFISYAWATEAHKKWVHELTDELTRFDLECIIDELVLKPGYDIDSFAQQIVKSDFYVPICSAEYTNRAEALIGGVGLETRIVADIFLNQKNKFLPVLRDNPKKRVPFYLRNLWYADMDRDPENWKGKQLVDLISVICERFKRKE